MSTRELAAFALLAACGSSGTPPGEAGGHCYPNGTCNVGLSCIGGFCVAAPDAPRPDAALDAPRDAPIDAAPDARFCNDDSAYEPDDSLGTAVQTPVDVTQKSVTYSTLAICPATDKDLFVVAISTAGENVEAIVSYSSAGSALAGSILNAAGTPIANMTSSAVDTIRGYIPNLPAGTYYVEVYSSSNVNNYTLTINVTP